SSSHSDSRPKKYDESASVKDRSPGQGSCDPNPAVTCVSSSVLIMVAPLLGKSGSATCSSTDDSSDSGQYGTATSSSISMARFSCDTNAEVGRPSANRIQ